MHEITEVRQAVSRLLTAVLFIAAIAAVLYGDRVAEAQVFINPGQTIRAGKNTTVKCRSCIPFQCPECPQVSPERSAPPEPTPAPSQPGTGSTGDTINLACSTYFNYGHRDNASADMLERVNKIRSYCDIVLTWWESTPEQTWCPYVRHNSTVKYCGPYDNWGYMRTTDDLFKQYVLRHHPEWQLKTSSGELVMNMWTPNETPLDFGNPGFVQFFGEYFERPPSSSVGWSGTYQNRSWNLRFLDNFVIRAINNNAWNGTPVNPRTGKNMTNEERETDVLNAMRALRTEADTLGIKYFANIWSDVLSDYFSRAIYPELMNLVDYALFEVFTSKYSTGTPESEAVWQSRVKTAQDINKNRKATAVITTEYGDYWYNLASGLLACEPGKCMFWQQSLPPDDVLAKVGHLDLGKPGTDFTKAGCYIRPWEKGLVVVNPMDSGSCSVPLSGNYKDLETGGAVSGTVTVKMKDGKVLVKE